MARPTRNCPFLSGEDRECEGSDCRLWITYIASGSSETIGECSFYIVAQHGLPRAGAALEPDGD